MDVNKKILALSQIVNLPVEEDEYEGNASEYVVFNYSDERSTEFGDDNPLINTASMMIKAVLKKNTDYFIIKDKIWEYLLSIGAYDITFQTYLERISNDKKMRNLIFDYKITKER